MDFFVIVLIVVIVFFAMARLVGRNSGKGRPPRRRGAGRIGAFDREPPAALGVPMGHPARPAAERLEALLSADLEARVKDRVLRARPGLRDGEWRWLWFELKRYFLLCAMMRNVPMYSEKVDEVWHELLMFTREYELFGKQLTGGFIHHAPHADGARPERGERAWFDWIYGELFALTPASVRLWGPFYRTPLPRERMEELERQSDEALRERYFRVKAAEKYPDVALAVDYLLRRGRRLAADARGGADRPYADEGSGWSDPLLTTGVLSGALFMSSMLPPDRFDGSMEEAHKKESGSSGGSDGLFYYGYDSGSHGGHDGGGHGGHDGGGHGGGSSCGGSGGDGGGSSCGGSGCGGGGD